MWKVSKYRIFSGPHFLVFGLNTENYGVNLRIHNPSKAKYQPEKTPYPSDSDSIKKSEFVFVSSQIVIH